MSADQHDTNIFHKLVTKEDDFTQLLCNLMNKFPVLRREIVKLLLGNELAAQDEKKPQLILTQRLIQDHGRPDIVIRGDDFIALIEVKVRLGRGPTPYQLWDTDAPRGYVPYLSGQEPGLDRRLVYLIPREWPGLAELDEVRKRVAATFPKISISTVFWEDIRAQIAKLGSMAINPILAEFEALLRLSFNSLTFSAEDIAMLESEAFSELFQAVRKLHLLVDQVAKVEGIAKSDLERQEDEYGFYFRRGKENLLWFGLWSLPWKEYEARFELPAPRLWFGLEERWNEGRTKVFRDKVDESKRIDMDGGWVVGWIDNSVLESGNAVDEILAILRPLVAALAE